MEAIRTILCPVDFSPATERQLAFAADLCLLFGAKLVLHHNLDTAPPGAAVGWMWSGAHPGAPTEAGDEERLRELMAGLPGGVEAEARITHGLPSSAVVVVAELVRADLVVITTHGKSPEEHTSVTEQVLERAKCGVLALHEAGDEASPPRLVAAGDAARPVVVPTDFSRESMAAVECAFELARRLPLEPHLLHIVSPAGVAARATSEEPSSALAEEGRRRLSALVPADLDGRVFVHVGVGDPGHEIAATAERLAAACVVMGEHTRIGLRRWFTRDTSRAVLHEVRCPVWYVPGATA
jgi:nucleotide-binding universal stress UspA family protein